MVLPSWIILLSWWWSSGDDVVDVDDADADDDDGNRGDDNDDVQVYPAGHAWIHYALHQLTDAGWDFSAS